VLRITEFRTKADDVTLCLQGSVAGAWIGELERRASTRIGALADARPGRRTIIDRDAVPVLRGLAKRGVRVERCSAFVRTLLKEPCPKSSAAKER
jgi:hypothetical protein